MPSPMKNPGKADCGSDSSGDSGGKRLAVCLQCSAGHGTGHRLRFSASFGQETPASGGSSVCASAVLGLAVCEFCGVPLRYPGGLYPGDAGRSGSLGMHSCPVAAAAVLLFVGWDGSFGPDFAGSFEKIFEICKNFVCICEKMGYNSMHESFRITEKAEKGIPWQTRIPPAKK